MKNCCFCGKDVGEFGNDPWPYFVKNNDARCCDACNFDIVLMARLTHMSVEEAELRTAFYTRKDK